MSTKKTSSCRASLAAEPAGAERAVLSAPTTCYPQCPDESTACFSVRPASKHTRSAESCVAEAVNQVTATQTLAHASRGLPQ